MSRNSFDAVSLAFGVVFAGLGLLFLTGGVDVGRLVSQFWPLALVVLGLAILFGSRRPRPRAGRGAAATATEGPGGDRPAAGEEAQAADPPAQED